MKLKISENIRRLRKGRGLTQEQLAERLSVSFQTVSKWERGDTCPDAATLPAIAACFDVTLDELFGMDEIRSEYRVSRIKKALRENYRAGKIADNIDLLNDELRYFPENAELLFELGRSLCLAHVDEQGERANLLKAVGAFEKAVKLSDDETLITQAAYYMNMCCYYSGDAEKALLNADREMFSAQKNVMLAGTLDGKAREMRLRENIVMLTRLLFNQIRDLADPDVIYNFERWAGLRREMLERSAMLLEWLFPNGDFYSAHLELSECYRVVAAIYMYEKNHAAALAALRKAADHAIAFDSLPAEPAVHTSLLAEGVRAEPDIFWHGVPTLQSERLLRKKMPQERYDGIRGEAKFKQIEKDLETFVRLKGGS